MYFYVFISIINVIHITRLWLPASAQYSYKYLTCRFSILDNLEDMFFLYYMHSDTWGKLKSQLIPWAIFYYEGLTF